MRRQGASAQEHFFIGSIPNRPPIQKSQVSTTGIWDFDVEKRAPSGNKLQENGISLPCRRRLSMLTTSSSRIASR